MKYRTAYLGIGSNIDAGRNIRSAIGALRDAFGSVALSPVYRSEAVGFEGDDFINLAAAVETAMAPLELNAFLHGIEDAHARDRGVPKWSSRTLDIDILLCDDLWLSCPQIKIPRKEILEFPHVLRPLAELAPDLVHPVERVSMAELWARFPKAGMSLVEISL